MTLSRLLLLTLTAATLCDDAALAAEKKGENSSAIGAGEGQKSEAELRKFLQSTKGTYGWEPVKGTLSYDFFPNGALHIQGPDGEATMWEGRWRLEGDKLTIVNSDTKKTKTVTAKAAGQELLLDGQRYRRVRAQ